MFGFCTAQKRIPGKKNVNDFLCMAGFIIEANRAFFPEIIEAWAFGTIVAILSMSGLGHTADAGIGVVMLVLLTGV